MKKQSETKDDTKVIKIVMIISLVVNMSILIAVTVFWVVFNNAGTNRYNNTALSFIMSYTDRQFCSGPGHEKLMKQVESSGASTSDIAKWKKDFDSHFCY